ncbi:MAG: hypothetical protein ACLT0Y_04435 [Christensenellales bacterium]
MCCTNGRLLEAALTWWKTQQAESAADAATLQTLPLTWMQSELQSFVHAQIEEEKQKVYVEIKTIGRKGETADDRTLDTVFGIALYCLAHHWYVRRYVPRLVRYAQGCC